MRDVFFDLKEATMNVFFTGIVFFTVFGSTQSFSICNGKEDLNTEKALDVINALRSVIEVELPSGGSCTGTIVKNNPVTILTAHHCVRNEQAGLAVKYKIGTTTIEAKASKVFTKRKVTWSQDQRPFKDDLALVVFEKSAVKGLTYPIDPVSACPAVKDAGSEILSIGFGCNDVTTFVGESDPKKKNCTGAGKQRWGNNNVLPGIEGLISFDGYKKDYFDGKKLGDKVGLGPGDSGGPHLVKVDGKYQIAGVSSYIRPTASKSFQMHGNAIVDLCEDTNKEFLSSTLKYIHERGKDDNLFRPAEKGMKDTPNSTLVHENIK